MHLSYVGLIGLTSFHLTLRSCNYNLFFGENVVSWKNIIVRTVLNLSLDLETIGCNMYCISVLS